MVDVSRRELLMLAGAAGAGLAGAGYVHRDRIMAGSRDAVEDVYRRIRQRTDGDLDGLPDALEESEQFQQYVEDVFQTTVEPFDAEQKDLIIDARYVEGETVPEDHKQYIERLFADRIDVNVRWMDHPETYDREQFLADYGYDPAAMLWGDDSFYEQEVADELKDVALQVVFVPGKQSEPQEGALYCAPGDRYLRGFSAVNRAVVTGNLPPEQRLRTTLHEIAHLGNYTHNYGDEADKGVFGQNVVTDLTGQQWERLHDRLHYVSLSMPDYVYDTVLDVTNCNDASIPE